MKLALFEHTHIRKVWHDDQWFFVVEDIIVALTDSLNPKDYLSKIKKRDIELQKGWGQIVRTLDFTTKGGKQKMNCAHTVDILRIIQSIPSSKAEPLKRWIEEENNFLV